jgi:hypothetical protein
MPGECAPDVAGPDDPDLHPGLPSRVFFRRANVGW